MSERTDDEIIPVLLLYPDTKEAALGSPGFSRVIRTLDADDRFAVDWGWYDEKNDRVVLECEDWQGLYQAVGFSVPYELLYSQVVRSLLSIGIEPERERRTQESPLIVLGGASPTINPVVAETIADFVYRGEAETAAADVIYAEVSTNKTGAALKLTPMRDGKPPTKTQAAPRFILPSDKIDSSFFATFDNPAESAFSDAGLVEVGRGCSRACRFCAAGHIYLPIRQRPPEDILRDASTYQTHARRIGLVGAAVSDYPRLKEVMGGILDMGFGLTTSSFRADMLDEELAVLLRRGGLKTVTIAPEGGSARVRTIINKRLTEEEILAASHACKSAGFTSLRLYFMVGLPWEHYDDIEAIVTLTGKIYDDFASPGSTVTVSVNPFIPKPQTPFQWAPMDTAKILEKKYALLEKAFRSLRGVTLKTLSIRAAIREAVLSLGNDSVGKAVIENARDSVPWARALKNNAVNIHTLIHEEKPESAVFPWDSFIEPKMKAALYASFRKAYSAAQSHSEE